MSWTQPQRSYWGDSINCSACYVGLGHTKEQHEKRVERHKKERAEYAAMKRSG